MIELPMNYKFELERDAVVANMKVSSRQNIRRISYKLKKMTYEHAFQWKENNHDLWEKFLTSI